MTPSTITDLQALFDRIRDDHVQGFSIVDEELERGLRAIAVPIVDRQKEVVAALNLSTHATRTTRNEMRDRFLPELRAAAAQIAAFLNLDPRTCTARETPAVLGRGPFSVSFAHRTIVR